MAPFFLTVAGGQFLCIVHDHLDGLAAFLREKVGDGDIHEAALAAEVTTDMHRMKNQLLFRHADTVRQLAAHGERRLAARPHLCATGRIGLDHASVRLEIRLVRHLRRERILDDQIGLLEALLDISFAPLEISDNVADAFEGHRQTFVRK